MIAAESEHPKQAAHARSAKVKPYMRRWLVEPLLLAFHAAPDPHRWAYHARHNFLGLSSLPASSSFPTIVDRSRPSPIMGRTVGTVREEANKLASSVEESRRAVSRLLVIGAETTDALYPRWLSTEKTNGPLGCRRVRTHAGGVQRASIRGRLYSTQPSIATLRSSLQPTAVSLQTGFGNAAWRARDGWSQY